MKALKIYAGIGSRETPKAILEQMTSLATHLDAEGYLLRSGGAVGADTAFEKGATSKAIYRAKDATEDAIEMASQYHPAWDKCSEYVRMLHGRNALIILGEDLKTPVDFVVCWTRDENRGGTSLGIRIARDHHIPVFNLIEVTPAVVINKIEDHVE